MQALLVPWDPPVPVVSKVRLVWPVKQDLEVRLGPTDPRGRLVPWVHGGLPASLVQMVLKVPEVSKVFEENRVQMVNLVSQAYPDHGGIKA